MCPPATAGDCPLEAIVRALTYIGFRAQGSGLRVQGSGFRVQGLGFRVQGAGFRV